MKQGKKDISFLATMMLMGMMMPMPGQTKKRSYSPLDNINIDKEAELIKQKKSDLSASERDWVMRQYRRRQGERNKK